MGPSEVYTATAPQHLNCTSSLDVIDQYKHRVLLIANVLDFSTGTRVPTSKFLAKSAPTLSHSENLTEL